MQARVVLDGWKGESGSNVLPCHNYFSGVIEVVEYRKNKESGEVKTSVYKVKGENVRFLYEVLYNYFEHGVRIPYRVIVEVLIHLKEWNVSIDAFNGGRNRAKYYFPFYYYPLKVLEFLKLIEYESKGWVIVNQ